MSTHVALYTSAAVAEVADVLERWLSAQAGGVATRTHAARFEAVRDRVRSFEHDRQTPTAFALARPPDGWTIAYFDAFHPLDELASEISALSSEPVAVVHVQTTAEVYLLSWHAPGCARWAIGLIDTRLDWLEGDVPDFPRSRFYDRMSSGLQARERERRHFGLHAIQHRLAEAGALMGYTGDPPGGWMLIAAAARGPA